MTTVIRIHRPGIAGQPFGVAVEDYVYIGRPSKWGNPFRIGPDGDRQGVIAKFTEYWYAEAQAPLRRAARIELIDKVLGCWCKPEDCHGDVIAEFVNLYGPWTAFEESKFGGGVAE